MPQIRNRIFNRRSDNNMMSRATAICIHENKSQWSVAEDLIIRHITLISYIKKLKASELGGPPSECGWRPHIRIFDSSQELMLSNYLKNYADMYFGLSSKNVRKLVFEFAIKLNLKVPAYWHKNESTSVDWSYNFLKRNPTLSIRQPEAYQDRWILTQ